MVESVSDNTLNGRKLNLGHFEISYMTSDGYKQNSTAINKCHVLVQHQQQLNDWQ